MGDLCGEGSVIAQDFYSKSFLTGEILNLVRKNMNLIKKMGEPWQFALEMSGDPEGVVEDFLSEFGLQVTEFTLFGEELEIEPFYCIAEATKRPLIQ